MSETTANTAPKLVTVTIDGKTLQVPAGTSVFTAAAQAGIFIPHYCYHPDLPVAGVCRMCMVDIEKVPRLQISCNTQVAEGMVVHTKTEKVRDTVKNILELHLVNHPLDCPICDKAGECKLQDFYRDYGLYESRMAFDKVHKPKAVDIGTIVLDEERCILCTRCVRFTQEVTKTNELGIFNRGDRSELRTYDHGPLKNEYTGNLADICPVGALTAKDFRFRQRVWFLDKESSVCTQCARGCNIATSVNPRTKKLFRVEPRRNVDVNKSWICDKGRWEYHYVEERRVRDVRRLGAKGFTDATWHEFFGEFKEKAAAKTPRILFALSTHMTNEEIVDFVRATKELGTVEYTWIVDEAAAKERVPYDSILQHKDRTPNAMGFERVMGALKQPWLRQAAARERLRGAHFDWCVLVGLEGFTMPGVDTLLSALPGETKLVAHATTDQPWMERCQWVLPNVTSFEKSGTAINALGRLQKIAAALTPQFSGRDAHAFAFGLVRGGDREASPENRGVALVPEVMQLLGAGTTDWRRFAPLGVPVGTKTEEVSP